MEKDADKQFPAPGGALDALDGELPGLLRTAQPSPPDLDALFRELEQRVAAERGLRAWLRARPTALRTGLAWSAVAAVAAVVALAFRRPDMAVYPPARMAAALLVLGAGFAISLLLALRPLQRPGVPARTVALATSAVLVGVLVLYGLPPAHLAHPSSLHEPGLSVLLRAIPCLAIGMAIGGAFYGLLALLDRGGSRRAPVVAVAAGLAANLALQLHCPVTAPLHMIVGHLGVALLLLAGAVLLVRCR
jgi:hypothetical protein